MQVYIRKKMTRKIRILFRIKQLIIQKVLANNRKIKLNKKTKISIQMLKIAKMKIYLC